MSYIPSVVDGEFQEALRTAGAVLLEGPKACGKTQTALQRAASSVRFDVDRAARDSVDADPGLQLEGAVPRLLDEWQSAPDVWDAVRRSVDERGDPGQFILTGSAVPADDLARHTGAMRILRLVMRPMTLSECGQGTSRVSLAAIARGESLRAADPGITVREVARMVARGGWPGNLQLSDARATRQARAYLGEIARADLRRVEGIRRDVNGVEGVMKDETIAAKISGLSRLMVVEDLPAWAPALRSRTRLWAASVRLFVDPSLAVAAVGADAGRLLADLEWFGFLFEGAVLRDIRVFSQALDARTNHYRDESGLEADIVIEFPDGRWIAVEVKLGHSQVDQAAADLIALRHRVDAQSPGEAVALVVVTATGAAYTRSDGVIVLPACALGE